MVYRVIKKGGGWNEAILRIGIGQGQTKLEWVFSRDSTVTQPNPPRFDHIALCGHIARDTCPWIYLDPFCAHLVIFLIGTS